MKIITAVLLFFVSVVFSRLLAQPVPTPLACSTLGQSPYTAFPVCGNDTFSQSTVPICTNKNVNVPGCTGDRASYADKNPFWYKFTCYQSGTLAFQITPNNMQDDYDWQLYDVTGITNLDAVYSNANLFVVGNWSGSSGTTGASPKGVNAVECASSPPDNISTFSIMPSLQLGHNYLLLVSHYSNSQSGYKLSFGGGTAVIIDPRLPDLQTVKPSCNASVISVKLNKKVKCSSLAANGTDFIISPALATVTAAASGNCSSSFDMDSITLVLSNPLPIGSYQLTIKKGSDLNTLLDACNRDIPEGHQLPFVIAPLQPTPLDSITPPSCAPSSLQLVFPRNILCSTIAKDGSDFVITGPAPVKIIAANGSCTNGFSSTILLTLSTAVVKGGTYQVKLAPGTDGNTILDECGQQTPAGASVNFSVKDTVSADFNYRLFFGCRTDTVVFAHDGNNGVNKWLWSFDGAGTSDLPGKTVLFNSFGDKQVSLIVSNGFCSDSISRTISLDNALKAGFETNGLLCPEDAATFNNSSSGKNIIAYNWSFGDGNTSIMQTPAPKIYPKTGIETIYPVQLIIENDAHCFDTVVNKIKVFRTCYIAVPNAFTPNGDGMNDYLYPLNAFKADNLDFNIYNRLGQLVFHSTEWTQKWDGNINGSPQKTGVYVWTLRYNEHDTGKKIFLKGVSVLIR